MLELKSVSWSNFLSYGDYETTLDFSKIDQALIVGEVIDDDNRGDYNDANPITKRRSNGAGKSTCPSVIQWVLFGRTMHSANPGDKILHWFSEADCTAKIEFKNGDSIIRTRRRDGNTELIYTKNGEQNSLTANTLATAKIQQARLNKEFNLDWDIFCGSVFFNQYGRPWMEMADQVRKKAIERVLHVDRFTYYANAAKSKVEAISKSVETKRSRIQAIANDMTRIDEDIANATVASSQFSINQRERQRKLLAAAVVERDARDAIILPDVDQLREKWKIVSAIETKIAELRKQSNALAEAISDKQGSLTSINRSIALWENKSGKICTSCEQTIDSSHTSSKINPLRAEKDVITAAIDEMVANKQTIDTKISQANAILVSKKPDMTVNAANELHTQWKRHDDAVKRYTDSAKTIATEEDPNVGIITRAEARRAQLADELQTAEANIEKDNFLENHYSYIHRVYTDRTKIKSYVFQDHIPLINQRLRHYLDVFDLDVRIELTSSLGISSNLWGYEFESGGERKRTDVAFMLAMFDFHQIMYGRQCNILVLDEVDGRLDDDGIDALINIIKNDLAPKVESILVISHRNLMFDTFPHEIRVVRENRMSRLEFG